MSGIEVGFEPGFESLFLENRSFVALCVLLAAASVNCGVIPATTFVRTPSFDSAVIKSDRLGGNFAYSTVEGHAYAAVSPVVQRVTEPVGVSYTAHQVNLGHVHTPVAVSQPIYAQQSVVAQPIVSHQHLFSAPALVSGPSVISSPIFAQHPVVGGIASPVLGGIASTPIAAAPVAPAAPTPVQGTVVDADTVAVESA
ncbi:hypothetical protein Zmor_007344 [Zophobas morio]|uniref:Cuticle protein n=1 Tax=Zophobas morio TaxID=2755281 RepID=A0AA38IXW1_9CUCU|nr:hypothetical protein Zmor_007344 [Zophobas morio]